MRYRLLHSQRPHDMKNLQIMSDANEANQPFEITHNQTRALACRSPISETVKYVVISTAKPANMHSIYETPNRCSTAALRRLKNAVSSLVLRLNLI